MTTKTDEGKIAYLPDETPSTGRLILYALQQVIVMFPATIAVALITGFQVSTTIFASGIATLCFTLITKGEIPLYYGSSFTYLSAVQLLTKELYEGQTFDILPPEAISAAQFGIIASGLISIAAGIVVRVAGKDAVEKFLPASITGPVSMVIGLTLADNAMSDLVSTAGTDVQNSAWLLVGLVTLLSTILYSRYLKGIWGQLPLLLGAATGCAVAALFYFVDDINLFRTVPAAALDASLWKLGDGSIFALPAITLPSVNWKAVAYIMPVAIATLPESTAHVYQLDIYINDIAKEKKSEKKYDLVSKLDKNLIGDGLCDMIAGLVGGPAGTNYGENISTMAITKVFSSKVMLVASFVAIVISCFTPLIKVIYGIPLAVIGGIEVYCFGAIAAQGIAILVDKKVSMFDSKNIAIIAVIMVFGLGTSFAFGGTLPFFGLEIPDVTAGAAAGIITNILLSIGDKKEAKE